MPDDRLVFCENPARAAAKERGRASHLLIFVNYGFSVTTLKDLFETVNTHTILDFIKGIGFYNRI